MHAIAGPQEWVWKEMASIADMKFRFQVWAQMDCLHGHCLLCINSLQHPNKG
jgi:hypothetical protein